ncbi:MAG: hypothetical protein SU899_04335, partial [Chloroflexota bacterium]|nr:hypothetical protein [Chloroflexota bacterium]
MSIPTVFGSEFVGATLLGLAIGLGILGLAYGVRKLVKRGEVENVEKSVKKAKGTASTKVKAGNFYIGDLVVSPLEAMAGEVVNISYKVGNASKTDRVYTAKLKINGEEAGGLNISLAPKETGLATFTVAETVAGEYKVEADGLEGMFIVLPASITISAIDINPRRSIEGGQVSIVAEVTNSGGVIGTQSFEITLRDKVIASEELTLAPGASQRV